MSSYKVSAGGAVVMVKTLQEVQAAVMEALTGLLAQDPEGVAEGARTANLAFTEGEVEQALGTRRRWRTSVIVHGETVPVVVTRRLW